MASIQHHKHPPICSTLLTPCIRLHSVSGVELQRQLLNKAQLLCWMHQYAGVLGKQFSPASWIHSHRHENSGVHHVDPGIRELKPIHLTCSIFKNIYKHTHTHTPVSEGFIEDPKWPHKDNINQQIRHSKIIQTNWDILGLRKTSKQPWCTYTEHKDTLEWSKVLSEI